MTLRAWEESIDRCQAEWDLRFGDWAGRNEDDVYKQVLLSTGDAAIARAARMGFYRRRLLAKREARTLG